jgi:DNA-binding MarR family transcriptional regulator
VVLIELTAAGQATADTIRQAIAALEARALAALPATAIAGFRDALEALTEVSA